MTLTIGPHTSIAGGFAKAGRAAAEIGANTFQFFTRNPRGGNAKALDPKDIAALEALMAEKHFGPLLAHAPYTLNMASKNPETRDFARRAFGEDLERLAQLPCTLYNFHPGSHVGQGSAVGIDEILEILNAIMKPEQQVTVLLEAMSGKGSEIGSTFEELKAIFDGVALPQKLGICVDTCHIFAAGYDIVGDLDGVLEHIDAVVGLERIKAIHLNDSMMPLGSHKDRHARLGEGCIGFDALAAVAGHPALTGLPFFLETPQADYAGYGAEIARVRAAVCAGQAAE
jgi:deoxyribonuclease-4